MLEVEGKKKVHENDRKTLGTSFASLSLLYFLPTQNINTFLDVIKLSGFSLFSPVSSTVLYPYSFFLSLSLSSQNQFTPDRVLLSCKFSPLLLMDSQEEREKEGNWRRRWRECQTDSREGRQEKDREEGRQSSFICFGKNNSKKKSKNERERKRWDLRHWNWGPTYEVRDNSSLTEKRQYK